MARKICIVSVEKFTIKHSCATFSIFVYMYFTVTHISATTHTESITVFPLQNHYAKEPQFYVIHTLPGVYFSSVLPRK
jgi:hypothetical protein